MDVTMTPHSETPLKAMNASEGKEVDAMHRFECEIPRHGLDGEYVRSEDAYELLSTQAATIASLQATIAELTGKVAQCRENFTAQAALLETIIGQRAALTARAEAAEKQAQSAERERAKVSAQIEKIRTEADGLIHFSDGHPFYYRDSVLGTEYHRFLEGLREALASPSTGSREELK